MCLWTYTCNMSVPVQILIDHHSQILRSKLDEQYSCCGPHWTWGVELSSVLFAFYFQMLSYHSMNVFKFFIFPSIMMSVAPGLRYKWCFGQLNMWLGWVDQVAAFRPRQIFRNQISNHLWRRLQIGFQIRFQLGCVLLDWFNQSNSTHEVNQIWFRLDTGWIWLEVYTYNLLNIFSLSLFHVSEISFD